MKKQTYIAPNSKVLFPSNRLLVTIPVDSDPNEEEILGKEHRWGMDDEEQHSWGRVWGRTDE